MIVDPLTLLLTAILVLLVLLLVVLYARKWTKPPTSPTSELQLKNGGSFTILKCDSEVFSRGDVIRYVNSKGEIEYDEVTDVN